MLQIHNIQVHMLNLYINLRQLLFDNFFGAELSIWDVFKNNCLRGNIYILLSSLFLGRRGPLRVPSVSLIPTNANSLQDHKGTSLIKKTFSFGPCPKRRGEGLALNFFTFFPPCCPNFNLNILLQQETTNGLDLMHFCISRSLHHKIYKYINIQYIIIIIKIK